MVAQILYSLYFHFMKIIATMIVSSLLCIFLPLLFITPKKKRESFGYIFGKAWGKTVLWLSGIKTKVTYEAELSPEAYYIFAGNHQSSFDIYLYYWLIPKKFFWIAKKSLSRIPFLGWAMALQGHIFVERENSSKSAATFRKTINQLKSGTSIAIYPEGTRSPDGNLLEFKKGAFAMARLSGMDMVPVTIKNACTVAPKGRFLINYKEEIEVTFHAPLNGRSKTLESDLRQIIERKLGEG